MADTIWRMPIVGVGSDGLAGLTSRERQALADADVIIGQTQVLGLLGPTSAQQLPLDSDLATAGRDIQSRINHQKLGFVVSGDPLFYGLAGWLFDTFGKDRFEVLPHVSSMQTAFARIKESWEDAYLSNLQSQPLPSVIERMRQARTVGLFTTPEVGPAAVALALLARGMTGYRAHVCENLGTPRERLTQGTLDEIASLDFDPLNILILCRLPGASENHSIHAQSALFGNPEGDYAVDAPGKALVTPGEIRSIALGMMRLQPGISVWDIGAGSGSVAIEAARLVRPGKVIAIEEDPGDFQKLVANLAHHAADTVVPVRGSAPAAFTGLAAPDAVFIGGVSHEVARLIEPVWNALRPGGTLVAHLGSIESVAAAQSRLRSVSDNVDLVQIVLARGVDQLGITRLDPLTPSFILRATK
jgi:precorrin-6Y C5,15-methyltransferase (decarboxylating)